MSILVTVTNRDISIYQRTELGKSTIGSWHKRQTRAVPEPGGQVSVSPDGARVIVLFPRQVWCMELRQKSGKLVQYDFHRSGLSKVSVDATLQPTLTPFSLRSTLLAVSSPNFRQTDGLVDVYQVTSDLTFVEYVQTLLPPFRAAYFGAELLVGAHGVLFVTAPFANRGQGAVFVYIPNSHTDEDVRFDLVQTLEISNSTMFGRCCSLSQDAQWLVVSSHEHIYKYRKDTTSSRYVPVTTLHSGTCVSVDNQGTVATGVGRHVFVV
jgi:hypothetical protein